MQATFIFQLKTCLGRTILYEAEHLDDELGVLDDATVATDRFVGDIRAADFALVLYLDELDVCDEAEHLNHMSDDLIGRNGLDQLDLIVGLEVSHLVLNLANYLEVGHTEHQLDVDVD